MSRKEIRGLRRDYLGSAVLKGVSKLVVFSAFTAALGAAVFSYGKTDPKLAFRLAIAEPICITGTEGQKHMARDRITMDAEFDSVSRIHLYQPLDEVCPISTLERSTD